MNCQSSDSFKLKKMKDNVDINRKLSIKYFTLNHKFLFYDLDITMGIKHLEEDLDLK